MHLGNLGCQSCSPVQRLQLPPPVQSQTVANGTENEEGAEKNILSVVAWEFSLETHSLLACWIHVLFLCSLLLWRFTTWLLKNVLIHMSWAWLCSSTQPPFSLLALFICHSVPACRLVVLKYLVLLALLLLSCSCQMGPGGVCFPVWLQFWKNISERNSCGTAEKSLFLSTTVPT